MASRFLGFFAGLRLQGEALLGGGFGKGFRILKSPACAAEGW